MVNKAREAMRELYGEEFVREQQKAFEGILRGTRGHKRVTAILEFSSDHMKGINVLDLGCGVGTFAILLAQRGLECIGLDISEYAIKRAKENVRKLNLRNVDFVVGSCDSNVFRQNSFDMIVAADIFKHLPQDVLEKTLMHC